MVFVGMIETNHTHSDIIDFGILTMCDHLILSHGTFGIWSALLSKNSINNTHVMPSIIPNDSVHHFQLDETTYMIDSGVDEFIYISGND